MQKKILTLAVAAVIAAPGAAMSEAVIYGTFHQSIDYADVKNYIAPGFDMVDLNVTDNAGDNLWVPSTDPAFDGFLESTQGGETFFILPEAVEQAGANDLIAAPGGFTVVDGVVVPNEAGILEVRRFGENGMPIAATRGQSFKGWGISGTGGAMPGVSRANRVGFKGSEDLGNGLKAIYQFELGLEPNASDNNIQGGNSGGFSHRNTFVGLAGAFGTVLVGRHDTPLKISTGKLDMFSDTMADYNGTVGFQDLRTDNTIAYISPSFSGVSFAAAVIAPGGATAGMGNTQNINSYGIADAYSLALIYSNGPFYASAAYESLSNEMFMNSAVSEAGKNACFNDNGFQTLSCNYVDNDQSTWKIGLGLLDWNGFTLSAVYEQQDDLPAGQQRSGFAYLGPDNTVTIGSAARGEKEQRLWQVQAGYAFGNSMVKAMYGAVDRDADRPFDNTRGSLGINSIRDDLEGDRETWAVGFDHSFSKRTKVYALYTDVTDDQGDLPGFGGSEWSGFSLGMIHKF